MKLLGFSNDSEYESLSPSQVLDALGITASVAELNYVHNVTSAIQTQLDSKQASLQSSTSVTLNGTQLQRAALTGDVTASANSNTTTISNNAVSNAKLADVPTGTLKGRTASGSGDPTDLTAAQVRALLNVQDGATVGATWGTNLANIPANITSWANISPGSKFDTPSGTTSQYIRGDGSLATFPNIPSGTVTSVSGGNGLTGSVTSSGSISLGTPGTITGSTTNSVSTSSHTHALSANLSAWDGVTVDSKANASDFTYVGNKSGDTYDSHIGDGNNFAYLWHSASGQPTDAPFSPTRQGAVLHMGNTWGRVQLAISNETTPQVFVRGATENTWTSIWTSGNFDPTAQPASNITSGTFAAARIPNLNASKITAGTFAAARIPDLSSSYVATSGNQTGIAGNKTFTGSITANVLYGASFRSTSGAGDLCGSGSGAGIRLMPNGFFTTNMTDIDGSGNMTVRGNVSVTGQVVTNGTNRPIQIYNQSSTHGYIEWYVESSASTRSGYLGFGSGSSSVFTIANQKSGGDIMLSTSGSGEVTANGNIRTTGTVSDSIGNVRKPEYRTANGTITLSSNDVNRIVEKSNNSSYTYTIPSGHGSHGDIITFVNSGTSGNLTINRATGVSLYRNGTNANITVGPGSTLTVYRSATSNRWIA